MKFKDLLKNDDAVSISVGFILMFSITVLVFSMITLSFYTLTQQSEKIAMRESFEILGSGLAVKITMLDTIVNRINFYGGTVNSLTYDFSIPAYISGESYSINITNKQIILEDDNGAKAWIPLNISTNLRKREIYSSIQDYKFVCNENTIRIEER